RHRPHVRLVPRADRCQRRLPDRLLHVRPVELHEDDPLLALRGGARRRRERDAPVLRDRAAALQAGHGGAGDARVHLDLQRLPLGDRVHELGRQAADHLVAPEPDRHLLHRQQPDLGGGAPRRRADDRRLRAAAAPVHQRPHARGEQGMTRVAFVGAGSVVFTKNLLGDLLAVPALADLEIVLHDIDPERLRAAEAMARWVSRERGARATVRAEDDRRRALDGADFVLNMVQIGGHEATLADFELPKRHGLRQTIADTLGIGGIFRALRTAPHMLALGNELAELCPDAWLLNYTNPMAMLCELVYQGTPTSKVVGLCHSVQFTVRDLVELVGVPEAEVAYLGAGINHQAFLLRLEHDGESLYPLLDERIAEDPELQRRVRVAIYRRFGYFPTESSEHAAEYVPWFMHHDGELDRFRIPVDEYIRRSEENLAEFARVRDALERGEPMSLGPSVEYAAAIVSSIVTG